jgi:hypothetical protein
MDISNKQLIKLRKLYFLRFNKRLSEEEALIIARKLLSLIKEIYKQINN